MIEALLTLVIACVVVTFTCAWVTSRLGEPMPYTDRSRGTGSR